MSRIKVALGFKAHSGWAAFVAISDTRGQLQVLDRRRIELIKDGEMWAKQPYHAAEDLEPAVARTTVNGGIRSARTVAKTRLNEIVKQFQQSKNEIVGCGVLVPEPMPDWSTDEILAVHFRMQKAEGVLFPDAILRAVESAGLPVI